MGSLKLGSTDTIIQPLNGLSTDTPGPIDIEFVALFLRSIAPVDIGGALFEIDVALNTSNPSIGTMQAVFHDPFIAQDTTLDVWVDLTRREVGNPSNTETIVVQDMLHPYNLPYYSSFFGNGPHFWPDRYPNSSAYPSGGYRFNIYDSSGPPGRRDFWTGNGAVLSLSMETAMVPVPGAVWTFAAAVGGLIAKG